ncbi:MAG TPA: GNAT family protein [Solirubrobacteraceae bacterium]|nr:GNAT family protein [Solirubrobacteraceae bacterium]
MLPSSPAVLEDGTALETGLDGIVLRRLTPADAEPFAAHIARDLEHVGEHLPWPWVTADAEGAARWLAAYEAREGGRVVAAGAWHGDALVGGGVLFFHDPATAVVELGVWTTAPAEGRGVATAACRALLAAAREELAVERVVWQSSTRNPRSRRLAEKLGFVHEGTLRSSYVLRGERLDVDVLSLVGAEIDRAAGRIR